ncbi:hypothetical protein EV401DRAFT_2061874 [Pisolithus croceorrhizus]|nr:hypothetical protein EV401DRAFT_2061874 [Pisolithus croceorrhizus]
MTLSTFHCASVSSKSFTLSVPHLKGMINIATNFKTPLLSMYLESDIMQDRMLAKNMQQELAYMSLWTVTAAVKIWYDPNPALTIIKEDSDEETKSKLCLQSLWLLWLVVDHARMIDQRLTMAYVAACITESFWMDLFITWGEDSLEKLVIHCCVLGGGDKDDDELGTVKEDIFLHQLENMMLILVGLQGVPGVHWVFLLGHNKTDGVNLKVVMHVVGIDFTCMYLNSCIEIFNILWIEATCAVIMKEL